MIFQYVDHIKIINKSYIFDNNLIQNKTYLKQYFSGNEETVVITAYP